MLNMDKERRNGILKFAVVVIAIMVMSLLSTAVIWSPQDNISLKNRYYVTNDPIDSCAEGYFVQGKNDSGMWNCTAVIPNTNTQKGTNGFYLYNDSINILFNETQLNNTINSTYKNGTGLSLEGTTFSILLSYFQGLFIELTDIFGGDVSGTYDNLSLNSDVVGDNELNYTEVTLNDFTNDASYIANGTDATLTLLDMDDNDILNVSNITLTETNHLIRDNATCVIITGDTATLQIC